jgi:hypothetical protein
MRRVKEVTPLRDYRLELTFDDGVRGTVDLSALVGKGVLSLWHDPVAFQRVGIGTSGELVWHDQVDLCPDALYLKVTGKTPEEVFPALRREPAHAWDKSLLRHPASPQTLCARRLPRPDLASPGY